MTWDELIGKIREGLSKGSANLRMVGDLVATVSEGDGVLAADEMLVAFSLLVLAVSNLHGVVEHLGIGLDSIAMLLNEADKS